MECNKDEAIRAMDIAKRKVTEHNYNEAKKFANKAQKLYSHLDGLKQVSKLIDVYISAGNKISGGEFDWYGILGVDPLADKEALKKQYKKLALLLHPDKNSCEGAEGAFKLVLAAWSLLSDNIKRTAYDQRRKSKEVNKQTQPPNQQNQTPNQQKQPPNQPKQPPNQPKQPPNQQKQPPNQPKQPPNPPPKQPPNQQNHTPNQQKQPSNQPKQPPNQHKQPTNQPKQPENQQKQQTQSPNQKQQPSNQKQQPPNQPSSNGFRNGSATSNKPTCKDSTLRPMCHKCRTQYVYVRFYDFNKTKLCRTCLENFMATEKKKTPQATNKNTNGSSSTTSASDSTKAANQGQERVKTWFEEYREKLAAAVARGNANSTTHEADRISKKPMKKSTFEEERLYKNTKTSGDANSTHEAERLFKNPMTSGHGNSTHEAERLFKNPMKTRNANSTHEAERLFKNPMKTRNANSTHEAERLFKNPMKTGNANSSQEAERLFKSPMTNVK
ncbi:DnaJ domain [Arabidopsis thaliana x Arabidopsis arenosa]|uniref:DnaJ domain n=1 Tax=Arabidopsis thaliana x Arabidopsis arenosa TaxID=1240361 RepID=A0A8T1YC72_9BRAS|nr:DnaJ domain [Arabidopsis thaliana x Arabidopsis arenosa]